jgi:phosphatidylinositol 4-kinase
VFFCCYLHHSYRGKAIRYACFYQFFYATTIVAVVAHAVAAMLINPRILGGSTDDKTLRCLLFTLTSTLCHVALFWHVRSSAPSEAELQLKQPKVLLYWVKQEDHEQVGLLNGKRKPQVVVHTTTANGNDSSLLLPGKQHGVLDNGSVSTTASSTRVQEISNKLVMDLQMSLNTAKKEWTKRLEDYHFRNGNGASSHSEGRMLLKQPPTPFRVVLELFAGEDVISTGRMDAVYDQDNGAALMFFIPQLLSFLLHGAYELSPKLEEWILETCRKNVYFAHKCYWFLRAWALESSIVGETRTPKSVSRLSKSSSLASFDSASDDLGSDSFHGRSKLLPEERAVIEDLMQKIMRCGEEPARILHFGLNQDSLSRRSSDASEFEHRDASPSALMLAAESGAIPIDPITGNPSAKHFECLAASRRFGFLPLDGSLMHPAGQSIANGRNGPLDVSYFDSTPVFLDALLTIADGLFKVSREYRQTEFKRQLKLLEVEALPCNEVYMPLQSPHHRVWRVIADESIAISTKERVPCIVCLEVVDYTPDDIPSTRDVRKLLELRSNGMDNHHKHAANEREALTKWRDAHRDPHRRETALEKLTYSMKHGIGKIPKKMSSSMKEHIKKLKIAKTDMEDFWSVRVPESFSFDPDEDAHGQIAANLHTMEPMPTRDIERGNAGEDDSPRTESIPVQPESPRLRTSSRGSMGQWTSPSPKRNVVQHDGDVHIDDLVVPTLKHPSYQTGTMGRRRSSARSIDTEQAARATVGDTNGTHSKPPTKPPPVVFKENWKEKEDRIRVKSAFGSLEGWRLLPVLVKPNDDLRQEQLASQLIYRMAMILARERVPVWLCPYEILALEASGGIIEAIPDTISIASLKKNDPNYSDLKGFLHSYFSDLDDLSDAKANFCESLAAYSMVCFLLQIKDRHNGNILLDNRGHLIHIDFGFFFLSSPGKNTGFESAPFKLTKDFVDVLDGPDSHLFGVFRTLCYRTFIALRKHCHEIILLVEMLKLGNEDLGCFRGRPDDAIRELRQRFRLDLNDRACLEYVNALIDESLENWRTNWYDRYQRYCVGVL